MLKKKKMKSMQALDLPQWRKTRLKRPVAPAVVSMYLESLTLQQLSCHLASFTVMQPASASHRLVGFKKKKKWLSPVRVDTCVEVSGSSIVNHETGLNELHYKSDVPPDEGPD